MSETGGNWRKRMLGEATDAVEDLIKEKSIRSDDTDTGADAGSSDETDTGSSDVTSTSSVSSLSPSSTSDESTASEMDSSADVHIPFGPVADSLQLLSEADARKR